MRCKRLVFTGTVCIALLPNFVIGVVKYFKKTGRFEKKSTPKLWNCPSQAQVILKTFEWQFTHYSVLNLHPIQHVWLVIWFFIRFRIATATRRFDGRLDYATHLVSTIFNIPSFIGRRLISGPVVAANWQPAVPHNQLSDSTPDPISAKRQALLCDPNNF